MYPYYQCIRDLLRIHYINWHFTLLTYHTYFTCLTLRLHWTGFNATGQATSYTKCQRLQSRKQHQVWQMLQSIYSVQMKSIEKVLRVKHSLTTNPQSLYNKLTTCVNQITHILRKNDVEVNQSFFQLIFVEQTITIKVTLAQLSTNAGKHTDASCWNLLTYNLCQTFTQTSHSECRLSLPSVFFSVQALFSAVTLTSDGNKTKIVRPRPIKQQQDYTTKKLFCCNTNMHVCYHVTLCRKRQKVIWWPVMLGTVSALIAQKIQVLITFQHYHVTQRLLGTTLLEAISKV